MLSRREALLGVAAAGLAAPMVARASQRRDAAVAAVERWAAEQKIPGLALAILEEGKPTVVRGLGVRSLGTNDPMTADTAVRVGSVAKAFAVIPLLRQVDQGKIDLDAPLSKYAPEFKVDDRITPRLAVSHASGMVDLVGPRPDRGEDSLREYVAAMPPAWRQFEPNTVYSYSNPAYAPAALAVEKVGGRPFLAQAEDGLSALGLFQSTFDIGKVLVRPHSVGHEAAGGSLAPLTRDLAMDFRHDVPPGMLWMSAEDAGRWMAWLINGPIANSPISSRAFAEMTRPVQGIPALDSGYGLGLSVSRRGRERILSHGGGVWGHSAYYEVAPGRGCGIALFANRSGFKGRTTLVETVMAELGAVPRTTPAPAKARPDHAGRFEHRSPGRPRTLEYVLAGDGVAMKLPTGATGPVLRPFRPDVFGSLDDGLTSFIRDRSGQVVGVTAGARHFART